MEEPSINVLVDAKTEYTKQLTNTLAPLIKEGFDSLYEDACKFKEDTNDPRYDDYSELQIFQDYLRKIPKWNQSIIDEETKRIIGKSQCEWLEDLLAAVFISNAKVLSVIRLKNPSHQMKLKIPKLRNFIHKCYVECSREIYQNVYLFDNEEVSTIEKQKNVRDIMNIVKEGIIESVRKLLPVREIIKTYLGKIYDDEDTENTTIETGFEQNLFMDFAKNNLRQNVEEIHSDTEIAETPKHQLKTAEQPEEESTSSESSNHNASDSISEDEDNEPLEEDNDEEMEQVLPHSFSDNNEDDEDKDENSYQETEEMQQLPVPQITMQQTETKETAENEAIDLMNFKPKLEKKTQEPQIVDNLKTLEQPQQLSREIIRQIEESEEAKPKMVYEKREDDTHYEVVSLAGSDKSAELPIVNIKSDNEQELLKTIVNREQIVKHDNENTLSSTDENVKKIVINKEEEDAKRYEMEKRESREQRRREKEERRARRKIVRNKDKRANEQSQMLQQPMRVDDNRFMFVQNGAEYVEDI